MSNEITDLDWLARNVHEWPTETDFVYVGVGSAHERMGWYPADYGFSKSSVVTRQQWLSRRAELQNKPSWANHQWPQIFQNEDGHWFGARAGWDFKAHIGGGWKGEGVSLLRGDGEYLQSGEVLGDWHDTLEKRPEEFQPFTSIEDNQEKDMKQDSGWFERGELPPVGTVCLYVVSDRRSAEVEITAHAKLGLCFVEVGKSGENYVSKTAKLHRFRPIRTERDQLVDVLSKAGIGSYALIAADAILAAGFSLRDK